MPTMDNEPHVNASGNSTFALTEFAGEPRARDLDIAERLGFDRPRNIRKLIREHADELAVFGVCFAAEQTSGAKGGRPATEFWLNEEQALLIATLSDAPNAPAVRAMLIKTFVAWRRGHLPTNDFDGKVTDLSPSVRAAIGGIVKGIVHVEMNQIALDVAAKILPEMLAAALARHNLMVRRGKTSGQILRESGFPPVKGLAVWFGNRLSALGYTIEGEGRCEQGDRTARMFDPDKVGIWLRTGGRVSVEQKVAERRGQKVIRLVPPLSEEARRY